MTKHANRNPRLLLSESSSPSNFLDRACFSWKFHFILIKWKWTQPIIDADLVTIYSDWLSSYDILNDCLQWFITHNRTHRRTGQSVENKLKACSSHIIRLVVSQNICTWNRWRMFIGHALQVLSCNEFSNCRRQSNMLLTYWIFTQAFFSVVFCLIRNYVAFSIHLDQHNRINRKKTYFFYKGTIAFQVWIVLDVFVLQAGFIDQSQFKTLTISKFKSVNNKPYFT